MINTNFFTTARIAGILLVLSLLIILAGAGQIVAQGRLGGMGAAYRGVDYATGDVSGLRTIMPFAVPYLMAQLAGFALLTVVLLKAGDRGTAVVALSFLVVATMISAIEASFHGSVTVWAAGQARIGTVPEFYEPLRRWLNYDMQRIYMSFQLTALLLFSASTLQKGLLPSWLGWAALAWTLLAFYLYFNVNGWPVVYIPTLLLLGVGLLWRG